MKMDAEDEGLSDFNSFLINQEIHANILELSKKRKLQGDQFDFPLPKHRFGDRSSGSEPEEQEITDVGFFKHGQEHLESSNDSNCFNSAMYLYPEIKPEPEFLKIYSYKQSAKYEPSTSSGSCGSNSFNTVTHCLNNMGTENFNKEEDSPSMDSEPTPATLTNGLNVEDDEIQQYSDVEDNEMMFYSNEAPPSNNVYVLSSGRWNTKQDAVQVQVRKPTIDQEFEQYFSMLML